MNNGSKEKKKKSFKISSNLGGKLVHLRVQRVFTFPGKIPISYPFYHQESLYAQILPRPEKSRFLRDQKIRSRDADLFLENRRDPSQYRRSLSPPFFYQKRKTILVCTLWISLFRTYVCAHIHTVTHTIITWYLQLIVMH